MYYFLYAQSTSQTSGDLTTATHAPGKKLD